MLKQHHYLDMVDVVNSEPFEFDFTTFKE